MAEKKEKVKFEWTHTYIWHNVKKQLGLSDAEYIYMDMIARLAPQHGGWTHISISTAAEGLDYSARVIKEYTKKLKALGLLEMQDFEVGDKVGKRGTAFWWECINNAKVASSSPKKTPCAENALPCAENALPCAENALPCAENAHYSKSNTLDNDFSKEKSTAVFSEKNLESENQAQPQIQKEKKERTQPPPTPPAENPNVQYLKADQIKTYSQPMFVSNTLWAAFIDATLSSLPNQKPKNKIAAGRFDEWVNRLGKEAATYSEPALLEIVQAYKISQDPNLREGKNAWLSIFHGDFTNHIQRIEKKLKSTTQNQNSQNGTINQFQQSVAQAANEYIETQKSRKY